VRAAFLGKHPEFTPAAVFDGALAESLPGAEVQLLPHRQGTDGFYISAFRR
jgi:16S rRNA C967 or C1407 C5-methylase (RsmB/RsmF family)